MRNTKRLMDLISPARLMNQTLRCYGQRKASAGKRFEIARKAAQEQWREKD
jgi:hypothetical protein